MIAADDLPTVEWEMFDRTPEHLVGCACGEMYHSHSKLVVCRSKLGVMARKPCPQCSTVFGHTVLHKPKQ